jgi:hypothetical protein
VLNDALVRFVRNADTEVDISVVAGRNLLVPLASEYYAPQNVPLMENDPYVSAKRSNGPA